jgi:hypothetical protein
MSKDYVVVTCISSYRTGLLCKMHKDDLHIIV